MKTDEDAVTRLVSLLEQASAALAKYNRPHWAQWLAGDADLIKRGDATGVKHFLSALGGMGSLNDVVFHPLNGDDIGEEDIQRINDEFRAGFSEAAELAGRMLRTLT